jgi:cytochrome oxidase Cu insertion factor (SCO1/SenC/PrrC family)
MRKILALIPVLTLATVLFAQAPASATKAPAAKAAPAQPRRPAGEFVIHMTDGSQKLLSSYRGKVVVMAFMYTTCTHCQHTAGILSKINNDYAGKGVQILGVAIDAGAQQGIPTFLKITGANFPVGFAPTDQALKFLHAPTDGWFVPMLAFIDRNGTMRYENIVTDTDDGTAGKFIEDQETTIPKEIDKYLKAPVSAATKQAPKS